MCHEGVFESDIITNDFLCMSCANLNIHEIDSPALD